METTKIDAATGKPYLTPFGAPDDGAAPVLTPLRDAHAAGYVVIEDYLAAEKPLARDTMLSDAGRAVKARETVASLEARLDKFGPLIETADKKVSEGRASLMRKAVKPFDVQRGMIVAAWLRDGKPEEKARTISRAIELGDMETLAAAYSAPLIWQVFGADVRWRERAERALLESSDPAALAELDRLSLAIQSVKEAHGAAKVWIRRRAGIETNADLTKQEEKNNEN